MVDNSDPAASSVGTWTAGTSINGGFFDGTNYTLIAEPNLGNSFTWPALVPEAGRYKVYAAPGRQWTACASNSPYTIHHAGGESTVTVDQSTAWRVGAARHLGPSTRRPATR